MSRADDVSPLGTELALREVFSTAGGTDPLALFESEAELVRTPAAASEVLPAAAPSQSVAAVPQPATLARDRSLIAVDQVLDRLGHVAWAEAVAIVEALCAARTSAAGGDERVPELSHISITAQGTIVAGAGVTGPPGPRLARTLHDLTAAGAIPVPLRLFVTKWISSEDEHSISDFAKELAYFARPNGAALIQAVYERAVAAPSTQAKPRPVPENAPPADQRPRSRRLHFSRWLAASVIVLGAALVSLLAWRGISTPSDRESTFTFATLLSNTVDMARRVAASVSERAGIAVPALSGSAATESRAQGGPSASAREAARTAPAAARPRNATPGTSTRPAAGSPAVPSSPTPRDASTLPAISTVVPRAPSRASVQADAAAERSGVNDVGELSPIYSSADLDVIPPEIRTPQLPAPLLSGVQAEVNTIELIISEAGTVERVRLLSQPRRMADMMLLSGAKTWSFAPASKRGQSVRYRLLLSWDATP